MGRGVVLVGECRFPAGMGDSRMGGFVGWGWRG